MANRPSVDNGFQILLLEKDRFAVPLLKTQGWAVVPAGSAEDLLKNLDSQSCDLVLLDADVLNHSAIPLLKQIKAGRDIPVILFSGLHTADSDICDGLNAGADDYILKSLSKEVVLAKVQSHLRRRTPMGSVEVAFYRTADGIVTVHHPTRSAAQHERKCNGYMEHRRCGSKSCREISLTKTEFNILAYFLSTRGKRVLSRMDVLNQVWGEASVSVGQDVVDKHVESLRKKLGPLGAMIKTIYGVGYQLQED